MSKPAPFPPQLITKIATLNLGEMFDHPCFQQFAQLAHSDPDHFSQGNGVKISPGKSCGYYINLYDAKIKMAILQGVPESELGGLKDQLTYSQAHPDHMALYVFLNCSGQTAQIFFGADPETDEIALVHTTVQEMSREAFDEVIGRR